MNRDPVRIVTDYHQATKHHYNRYARSLGYLDWATQPAPFRSFEGTETWNLDLPDDREDGPTWDALFAAPGQPAPLAGSTLSRFFFHSLALSAWKQVVSPEGEVLSRWALRVNPSSGNLHPTEAYLVAGAVDGLHDRPAVLHYAPDRHLLEGRGFPDPAAWDEVATCLPTGAFLIGLSSIHWREAWKYGERAFRYCQHDVGHALAAVALAGARLGWRTELLPQVGFATAEALLGTGRQTGPEKEVADCLVAVLPATENWTPPADLDQTLAHAARSQKIQGSPNQLSSSHVAWDIIGEVSDACHARAIALPDTTGVRPAGPANPEDRGLDSSRLIRSRRSAVSMDGSTDLPLPTFVRLLQRLLPGRFPLPYATLNAPVQVSLILFVHRVPELPQGLYCLVRDPAHQESLRASLRPEFAWSRSAGVPHDLPLFLLAEGDTRQASGRLCCGQDIAADGAFAVGMLARFREPLQEAGPGFYRHLFWETGVVGQMLYLEAEAAGLRGTGIGCFFDDEVHRALGLPDDTWQSLYHFTVGGGRDDGRLQSAPAYAHLER